MHRLPNEDEGIYIGPFANASKARGEIDEKKVVNEIWDT